MPEERGSGEVMIKTRQQRFALRVALYVLQKNGFAEPNKRHVLNFIRKKRFLQFPEQELQRRWDNDSDEIWENDIAWKRKDLYLSGEIDSPERGKWRLTSIGVKKVEEVKAMWLKLGDEEEKKKFLHSFEYCTEDFVSWLLKIARGESLRLTKEAAPQSAITNEARMMAEDSIKNGLAQMVAEKLSAYLGIKVETDAESLARAISARNRKIDVEMKAKLRAEFGLGPV